jgi:long-subunit fatty acid transport protein
MRTVFYILLIPLACLSGSALAQEERAIDNFSGVGVRAMGMGGAFVGVADDFTAIYWNPAGLAQIDHREVQVSFLRNSHANDSKLAGTSASSELSNTRFGSMGAVFPFPVYRGSLVFAAGFNRIKDFDWGLDERGFSEDLQSDHSFRHEGELALTSLAAAVDVSPSVSLGMTVGFVSGDDKATNEFSWTDSQDLFEEKRFLARDSFEDEYESAFYAALGGMVRSSGEKPRFRIGATIATGTTHEISYVFRGASSEVGYDLVEYDDGSLEEYPREVIRDSYKISLPLELAVGASYAPLDGLLLAGSLHFTEWEQSEYEGRDDSQLRAYTSFEKQYRNSTRYHLGVEWQVPTVALDLRAGFYSDPLPFVGPRDPDRLPDPISNPEIDIEQDRRFITLGAGLRVDEVVQIDMAWVRGSFEQVEGKLREDNSIHRLFASVGYVF